MSLIQTNFKECYTEGTELTNSDEIKDIKEKLEVKYRAKLCRHRPPQQLQIKCHNSNCLFEFSYYEMAEDQFVLINSFTMHLIECQMEAEDLLFHQNRKRIIDLKDQIYYILRTRHQIYGLETPARILQLMEESGRRLGIFEGVVSVDMRRRLKKKFDNIVAEEKRRLAFDIKQGRVNMVAHPLAAASGQVQVKEENKGHTTLMTLDELPSRSNEISPVKSESNVNPTNETTAVKIQEDDPKMLNEEIDYLIRK